MGGELWYHRRGYGHLSGVCIGKYSDHQLVLLQKNQLGHSVVLEEYCKNVTSYADYGDSLVVHSGTDSNEQLAAFLCLSCSLHNDVFTLGLSLYDESV